MQTHSTNNAGGTKALFSAYLPRELIAKLNEIAAKKGVSRNKLVGQFLARAVARHPTATHGVN